MKSHMISGNVHRRDRVRGKSSRVGVMIAQKIFGTVVLGWSRCNTSAGDKFDHKQGIHHACNNVGKPLPTSFMRSPDLSHFRARVACYFPDDAVPTW